MNPAQDTLVRAQRHRRAPGASAGTHKRGWAVTGLGVAVAVALVVVAVLLVAPAAVSLSAAAPTFGGTAQVATLPSYGARGMHVVGYEHGAAVSLEVPVRNDGRLPVTVTGAATGAGVLPLLEVRQTAGLPLRLGPGEQGTLVLQAVLTNCAYYHEREVQVVDTVRLDVQVLGRGVRRDVALDRPILVHSPMIVGCPDRKLDRQANDRLDAL